MPSLPQVPVVLRTIGSAIQTYRYLVQLVAAIESGGAGGWQNGGNAFGAGTGLFGTTDAGDGIRMFAAGPTNTFLQTDGVNTYVTAATVGGEARVYAGSPSFPAPAAGKVRVQGATGSVFGSGGNTDLAAVIAVRIGSGLGIAMGPSPSSVDPSAGVDMSTWVTVGLGLPQVPGATLTTIATPLAGLTAFDTTNGMMRVNVGTSGSPNWRKAAGGPLVRATNTSRQSISATTGTTTTGYTAVTNQGGAFVPATGIFTAPVPGFYSFSFGGQFVAGTTILNGAYRASLLQAGSVSGIVETREVTAQVAAISAVFSPSLSTALQMAANDTMGFQVFQGTGGALALSGNAPNNSLSIALAS